MNSYTTELKNWLSMRREALQHFKSNEAGGYLEAKSMTLEGLGKKKVLSKKQQAELRKKKREGGK